LADDKEHDNENNDIKNDIIRDYDSIIRESALLTTVSGFLFGFLLNTSINTPRGFGPLDSIVLMISLFAITLVVSLFAMPVAE
jgi:ABC-type phosphate/phosphonate transport system permease subunit